MRAGAKAQGPVWCFATVSRSSPPNKTLFLPFPPELPSIPGGLACSSIKRKRKEPHQIFPKAQQKHHLRPGVIARWRPRMETLRDIVLEQLKSLKPSFISKKPHFNFISAHCKCLFSSGPFSPGPSHPPPRHVSLFFCGRAI